MEIYQTTGAMQSRSSEWNAAKEKIAFVPTMGALHHGHAALLRQAKTLGTKLVLSIFINPLQFGPGEDLDRYPRPLEADLELARAMKVDAVFAPSVEDIYPAGFQTVVHLKYLTVGLCGARRPGHFDGVSTIVLKLLQIVRPHVAVFGEKDYQQLQIVRRMVKDLSVPVAIAAASIVRDPDGLATSSRNSYLTPDERTQALAIPRSLERARQAAAAGSSVKKIVALIKDCLKCASITQIDYVSVVDPETLKPLSELARPARCCLAVWIGNTRLIDNTALVPAQKV